MSTPTHTGRPSGAAFVLMVLCAWPVLVVLAHALGTSPERLASALAYGLGFTLGVFVLIALIIQLLRR